MELDPVRPIEADDVSAASTVFGDICNQRIFVNVGFRGVGINEPWVNEQFCSMPVHGQESLAKASC